MSERIAVVTGAGGGIGRATVARLVRLGYRVVAVGRRQSTLDETVQSLKPGEGGRDRVRTAVADVRDAWAVEKAFSDLDSVHAVVANAGVFKRARLDDPEAEQVWHEVLDINLNGTFNTLRPLADRISEGGRIVCVASGLGKLGRVGYGAYCASKHGMLGLVKCLAKELGGRKITVNAVCPGWVETDMAWGDFERTAEHMGRSVERLRAGLLRNIPLGRFVEAGEVADLICFLLSDEAAAVTGEAYNISCGDFYA